MLMKKDTVLIPIDHTTMIENLQSKINDPNSTYTLFLLAKHTTLQQVEAVNTLRSQLTIPQNNHLTINISSIVQKTWRIINHYSPTLPLLKRDIEVTKNDSSSNQSNSLPLPKGELVGVEITPSLLEKSQPNRQKLIRTITKINQERLTAIEESVKKMVIQDQTTKLDAKIIYP